MRIAWVQAQNHGGVKSNPTNQENPRTFEGTVEIMEVALIVATAAAVGNDGEYRRRRRLLGLSGKKNARDEGRRVPRGSRLSEGAT